MIKDILYVLSFSIVFHSTAFADNDTKCTKYLKKSIQTSLLTMNSQKNLRADLKAGEFKHPDSFIYSYTTKRDIKLYHKLTEQIRADLNPEQTEALNRYTAKEGTFDSTNTFLREIVGFNKVIPPKPGRAQVTPETPIITKALDSIFATIPSLPKGLILFRGMPIDPRDVKIPSKGKSIRFPQFLSTSLDPQIAHHFASYRRSEQHRYLFIIKIGSDEIPGLLVGNERETEIILPRSLSLRVDSKRTVFDQESGEYGASYTIIEFTAERQKFDNN